MKYLFSGLFFLLLTTGSLHAQTPTGKPFITNYDPAAYKAHVQNFTMDQDSRGIFYIGNGDGMLEFDGENWRLMPLPKQTSAFAIEKAPNGTVFIGAEDEFGYLASDTQGVAQYRSLLPLLPDSMPHYSRVSRIYPLPERTIFHAELRHVFELRDSSIRILDYETPLRSFRMGEEVYFWDTGNGLRYVENGGWQSVENPFFRAHAPAFIIPEGQGRWLMYGGTFESSAGGRARLTSYHLYRLSGENPAEAEPQVVDEEYSELLNLLRRTGYRYSRRSKTERLPSGDIAVLDETSWLYLLDKYGRLKQEINEENGLASPTILSFGTDDKGNLLLGTNNGVSHVEITSPVSFWDKKSGLVGVVESLTEHKGNVLVGTHQGLYRLEGSRAVPVPGDPPLRRQTWSVFRFTPPEGTEEQLLIAHIDGVYRFRNGRTERLFQTNPRTTVFEFYQSKRDPKRVFLSYYDGFGSMRYEDGTWVNEGKVPVIEDELRSVAEDSNGDLWVSSFRNGVIRMPYYQDPAEVQPEDIRYYQLEDGFESLKNIIVYEWEDAPVFATEQGLYRYQAETDSMIPAPALRDTPLASGERDVFSFSATPEGDLWAAGLQSSRSPIGVLRQGADGTYRFDDTPFWIIPDMMVLAHYVAQDGTAWFGGSKGLFRYLPDSSRAAFGARPVLIRNVRAGKDDTLHAQQSARLDYDHNFLTFNFVLPDFGGGQNQYRYRLRGYSDRWSQWTTDHKANYTNLFEGSYTFEVQAKNRYGNLSEPAQYRFRILPPWYRKWWAYVLYGAVLLVTIWGIVRLNTRRLQREKEKLEGIVKERTAEIQTQKEEIQAQADNLLEANTEIRQQKEELETQAEQLKTANNALERSHRNLQTLAEMGQQINENLSVEKILQTTYERINQLMDAAVFAIGIHEHVYGREALYFPSFIERGETIKPSHEFLDEERLSAYCFNRQETIFIENLEEEYHHYLPELHKPTVGEIPASVIYLPLIHEGEKLGVLTVQSFESQAYSEYDLEVLRNLEAYISNALDNAQAHEIIEERNREVMASINYAQRIQQAILPDERTIKRLLPESFVLFKPRDVVSGDFYWLSEVAGKTIVAAVDCTGHGVPGAFMSMIGETLLNEIVNGEGITMPAAILQRLDERIRETLRQQETNNQDGMDMSLCLIDSEANALHFAGAKNPLVYIQEDTLHVIKGDRRGIGGYQRLIRDGVKPFTSHTVSLDSQTHCYLFSDGYQDQFGGKRNRKFKPKRLYRLLHEVHTQPHEVQHRALEERLEEWKNGQKQIDDILVVGFTVGKA